MSEPTDSEPTPGELIARADELADKFENYEPKPEDFDAPLPPAMAEHLDALKRAAKPHPLEAAMLAEAREDVLKADQKSSIILATLTVGVAAVLGGILAGDWNPPGAKSVAGVLWWIGVALMAAAIVWAALAVWPRYDAADGAEGVYYWAHVASFGSLPALSAALDDSPPDPAARTRNQLWEISKIVGKKYRAVRWSIGLAGASLAVISLSLLLR